MKTIVLISCGKKKCGHRAQAQALYVGSLFTMSLAFAQKEYPVADVYILSAKHGLLRLEQEIEPYEQTLNRMNGAAIEAWAERVLAQLGSLANFAEDSFVFLAGDRYRRYLEPHMRHTNVPMKGLQIGRQLMFLKSQC